LLPPPLLQYWRHTNSNDVGFVSSTATMEAPIMPHNTLNDLCIVAAFTVSVAESKDVGIAGSTATMEASTTKKSPLIAPDSGAGHHHVVDDAADTAHLLEFKETSNEVRQ
jgi:hypothetical protein